MSRRRLPWSAWWFVLPVVLPLAAIFASALRALATPPEIWPHLLDYVLPQAALNTFWLVAGVALLAALLGITLGALVALTEFPGRRWFEWSLLLPLAAPGYVLAFVYIGLLDFAGPVQAMLRATGIHGFPEIRSRGGVILVLGLTLYPYVYLLAREAFRGQGARAMEAARSLGMSWREAFLHAALPLARPWIAGGVGLVVMETLADFGTVAAFNYDTFTTAIYKTWFALFSFDGAMQLAAVLVTVVLVLAVLEQRRRLRRRFVAATGAQVKHTRLGGGKALAATLLCGLVLAAAFILPLLQLIAWSVQSFAAEFSANYLGYLGRSLLLAASGALLIVALAVLLGYALRNARGWQAQLLSRLASLGYALPGPVIAVGLFAVVAMASNGLTAGWRMLAGEEASAFHLQGTLAVLLIAYLARFLAVGFNPVESAFGRIGRNLDEAARSLGATSAELLARVHLPLLRGGVLTGAILAFVDVLKDMPITLMLRPYGWETLATRVFELTSEGEYARAALPAVAIVLAGMLPVLMLIRSLNAARNR